MALFPIWTFHRSYNPIDIYEKHMLYHIYDVLVWDTYGFIYNMY